MSLVCRTGRFDSRLIDNWWRRCRCCRAESKEVAEEISASRVGRNGVRNINGCWWVLRRMILMGFLLGCAAESETIIHRGHFWLLSTNRNDDVSERQMRESTVRFWRTFIYLFRGQGTRSLRCVEKGATRRRRMTPACFRVQHMCRRGYGKCMESGVPPYFSFCFSFLLERSNASAEKNARHGQIPLHVEAIDVMRKERECNGCLPSLAFFPSFFSLRTSKSAVMQVNVIGSKQKMSLTTSAKSYFAPGELHWDSWDQQKSTATTRSTVINTKKSILCPVKDAFYCLYRCFTISCIQQIRISRYWQKRVKCHAAGWLKPKTASLVNHQSGVSLVWKKIISHFLSAKVDEWWSAIWRRGEFSPHLLSQRSRGISTMPFEVARSAMTRKTTTTSHCWFHPSALIIPMINNEPPLVDSAIQSENARATNLSKSSSIGADIHWGVHLCLPARLSSTELRSLIRMQLVESSEFCDAWKIKVQLRSQHNGLIISPVRSFSLARKKKLTRYRLP